tara:strand:+ start:3098 stop:3763 length:666 start_codon:yes stop_codon:yes gene_type:complete
MAYTPKSKISFKSTSGRELIAKLTKKYYIGDYMEFSNGKLYAGKNSSKLKVELIPFIEKTNNRMGNTYDTRRYNNLKPPTKKSLSKYKQVPSSKPFPTEEDYKVGFFARYIAKRVNQQFGFIEIDNKTAKSISENKKEYDPNLYVIGTLIWSLKENAHQTNNLQLQRLERTLPLISTFFPNLSEYKKNNIQNSETLESPTTNQSTPSPPSNNSGGNNNSGY